MRIDTGHHMRMDQRMKLAPRMIQSMEILQMPQAALEERIEQELSSNPTLELREPGSDKIEIEKELEQERRDATEGERILTVDPEKNKNNVDDFERLSNISEEYAESWDSNSFNSSESYRPNYSGDGERDAKMDAMANTAARPESLHDQLLDQWRMVETTPEIRAAGEFLIGFVDTDGYIRHEQQSLLSQAPQSIKPEAIDAAWLLMQQTLEPVGIGARDLRECLLLQIDAKVKLTGADLTAERLIVSEHLKDVEMNRLPRIAKATGLDLEKIKSALLGLRQFDPHPGRMLSEDQHRAITPDAIIEYDEVQDCYVARLTNNRLPNIHVNPAYLKMARDAAVDRKTKDFIGGNLRSARWLIDAIAQRSSTLLRVINVVIHAQRDFFDLGPQALKPLPMTLVADQLGIHVATVSRAVSEKYLQTPRGIFPLRMFFSGGTETDAGDSMSWAAVQAKLQEVIDQEDKSNPLSDDQLVDKLKEAGIEIARRTVAKYRQQLHIASARQRKQF